MTYSEKLLEAEARAETVRNILSIETHPDIVKNYKMELGRIGKRICLYKHKIKYQKKF